MGIMSLKSAMIRALGKISFSAKGPDQGEGIKSFKENQKIEEAVDQRYFGFR
jgi:hypothetical protein